MHVRYNPLAETPDDWTGSEAHYQNDSETAFELSLAKHGQPEVPAEVVAKAKAIPQSFARAQAEHFDHFLGLLAGGAR